MNDRDERFDQLLKLKVNACTYKKLPLPLKQGFALLHLDFNASTAREDWDSDAMRAYRDKILETAKVYIWTGLQTSERIKTIYAHNEVLYQMKGELGL